MVRLSDIRIGTKLSMMSGLGVLLVVAMIVVGMRGNAEVKSATDTAMLEQTLTRRPSHYRPETFQLSVAAVPALADSGTANPRAAS